MTYPRTHRTGEPCPNSEAHDSNAPTLKRLWYYGNNGGLLTRSDVLYCASCGCLYRSSIEKLKTEE